MAKDSQLLDIAQDYLQFITNSFEAIDASATHIYHSALELSPLSSIVRKLYYSQRPPLPKVVFGIPDSWDLGMASNSTGGSYYISSTWSPCGQFVAAMTRKVLEIRDGSTLKPLSTIQSTKIAAEFRHGLAYSPDGHSLAGCSNIGIVIWDIQTGGVAKRIACEVNDQGLMLVWSLDGMTIGALSRSLSDTNTMHTYDIASGAIQSSGALKLVDGGHLWAHNKSFWVMVGTMGLDGHTINIFEVGSTLTKVEQFPIQPHLHLGVFSPTTYRISTFHFGSNNAGSELLILDIRSSEVLLQEKGCHHTHCFSPDGTFFAASLNSCFHIWRYTSGHYTLWRKFQQDAHTLKFSPTLSSILESRDTFLSIFRLDSPASLPMNSVHYKPMDAFSPNGTYIVTANWRKSTITITSLDPQHPSPSQFIDTNFEILAIALTGNVLLVMGPDGIVAWLLTEEGVVNGMFKLDKIPQFRHHFHSQGYVHGSESEHYHRELLRPLERDWPVSKATLRGGWVKDPEGKHRMWLHVRWRSPRIIDWLHYGPTLRLDDGSKLIFIRF